MVTNQRRLRNRQLLIAVSILIMFVGSCATSYHCICGMTGDIDVSEAERLVKSGEFIGLSESEIRDKFGKPTNSIFGWDLAYFLSRDASCIDNRWLVFEFDPSGRVTAADIATD